MDLTRRYLMAAGVATVAMTGSGCMVNQEEKLGDEQELEDEEGLELYFNSDLDKAPVELDGMDIYVNLTSLAKGENLQRNRIECQKPGEQAWKALDAENVNGEESYLEESYAANQPGEHKFRAVVEAGGEHYTSETEVVKYVNEIENSI